LKDELTPLEKEVFDNELEFWKTFESEKKGIYFSNYPHGEGAGLIHAFLGLTRYAPTIRKKVKKFIFHQGDEIDNIYEE
jgi:hypothetical protein